MVAKNKPKKEAVKEKPKKVAVKKSIPKTTKPKVQKKMVAKNHAFPFSKANVNQLKNMFRKLSSSGTPRVIKDSGTAREQSLTSVREVSGKKGGISASAAKSLGKIGGGGLDGSYDSSTGSGRTLFKKKGFRRWAIT